MNKEAKVKLKDDKTTTSKLGMRVTGYVIKDENGEIQDKSYKVFEGMTEETIG
mgnify:CR=1 FL=1